MDHLLKSSNAEKKKSTMNRPHLCNVDLDGCMVLGGHDVVASGAEN